MDIKKVSWTLLFIAFIFNFGAYVITIISLPLGFTEQNGLMASVFSISHIFGILPLIFAYICLVLIHRYVLKLSDKYQGIKKNIYILMVPVVILFFFSIDFIHDFFLVTYNIGVFNEFANILIFR